MLAPLHRVTIFVGDVEKCAQFYANAFGFTILPSQHAAKEWLELETGGCRLAFHKASGPNGPIDSPTGSAVHPHKIVFYAENVEATRSQLMTHGAAMGDVHKFGDLMLCDGKDPGDTCFRFRTGSSYVATDMMAAL